MKKSIPTDRNLISQNPTFSGYREENNAEKISVIIMSAFALAFLSQASNESKPVNINL